MSQSPRSHPPEGWIRGSGDGVGRSLRTTGIFSRPISCIRWPEQKRPMSLFLFRAKREKAVIRLAGLGRRRKPPRETVGCSARSSRRRGGRWTSVRGLLSNAEGRVLQAAAFPAQAREPTRSTAQPPRCRGPERSTINVVNVQHSKGRRAGPCRFCILL